MASANLVIQVQSLRMLTANLIPSVFFLTGALADCPFPTNLFISTPVKMEALSGSCLQIPCNFSAREEHEFDRGENFGVWIKNYPYFNTRPENVVFNSSGTVRIYPMNITGDLSQNQCTTLFSRMTSTYTDRYYFRVHSSSLRAVAVCDPLQITVTDSPPSPTINISGDLTEEESVYITCSALTPCPQLPPKLTWNLQKGSQNNMVENADGTFTTQIKESITLTDKHDGLNITCSAAYPVNGGTDFKTAEEMRTLRVSYSSRNTSVIVSPSDPVSDGSTVNLTCSCRRNPSAVHFFWFMISNGRLELLKVDAQVYVLEVKDSDRGRLFFCGCRNDRGIQMSAGVQLTFEGDQLSEPVSAAAVLKILGIVLLISALIIFECWFRSRDSIKPRGEKKNPVEAVYVNTVAALAMSQTQAASAKPI